MARYGVGVEAAGGGGGDLNFVSSTGTLSLISVNLRVVLKNESMK